MIKAELHSHTSDDPCDPIEHSARDLIDRAAALGYGALAITLHDRQYEDAWTTAYAASSGVILIPAVERTIGHGHVLLLNFPREADRIGSFEELRAYKRDHPEGLVIAPHPFYPIGHSLGRVLLDRHADLWDAVEINAYYTRTVDFNRRARVWAREHAVPLVGNGDVHQLRQLGTTFSLIDVEKPASAGSICRAIRGGLVSVESRPISHLKAARIAVDVGLMTLRQFSRGQKAVSGGH